MRVMGNSSRGLLVMDTIVGLLRFSFLGKCDWFQTRGKKGDSPEVMARQKQALYAETRLAKRFEAFEKICLPAMKAQTDQDFQFWVLTSPELPDPWLTRLHDLCAELPQAQLMVSDARTTSEAYAPALRQAAEAAGRPAIQFRIDDDDAVSRHHVARIRREAARLNDLPGFGLSFLRGLVIGGFSGRPMTYFDAYQAFAAAGAAVRMPEPDGCIYDMNNPRIPRLFPSFTDMRGFGYVQTRWDQGNSAAFKKDRPVEHWFTEISAQQFQDYLADDFPFLQGLELEFVREAA